MPESHQERLKRIQAKYPNAYQPWSGTDDNTLLSSYENGLSKKEISEKLQRQPNAIRSRLKKLNRLNTELYTNIDSDEKASLKSIMISSFAGLSEQNPESYNLLFAKVRTGYFEKSHSRQQISDLSKQLIETVSPGEDNHVD
jgi:hypothetical protein